MYYAVHHVKSSEKDDYMSLQMLKDLVITSRLRYVLLDPEAGEARIVDVNGRRLQTITDQTKDREWQILAGVLKSMNKRDIIVAEALPDLSDNKNVQKRAYEICLQRGIELQFLKTPYMNSANFTTCMTRENKSEIEAVIWQLMTVPIVYDENSQSEFLKTYRQAADNQSEEVKKTVF